MLLPVYCLVFPGSQQSHQSICICQYKWTPPPTAPTPCKFKFAQNVAQAGKKQFGKSKIIETTKKTGRY